MINAYFEKIEKTILDFTSIIKTYSTFRKIYNEKQGYIKGIIHFTNDSQLRFVEVKDAELKQKNKYRYHYMDKSNRLIFRYDNANHHKELKASPHHKHSEDSIQGSIEPELFDILLEVHELINQEREIK